MLFPERFILEPLILDVIGTDEGSDMFFRAFLVFLKIVTSVVDFSH